MGAGHTHNHADARISRMLAAAVLLASFFVVEVSTALLIGSIALLADAGHLLTDLAAAFMGLAALMLVRRGSSSPGAPTAGTARRCSPRWSTRCC
ncbi:cation efflux family protein [Mycobacterium xenopi 3993]|nr:cation efflux family protein [Mycobacterium xenopi 3993]